MNNYDSAPETRKHIAAVEEMMRLFAHNLDCRAAKHDKSKLESPEKEVFDEFTPKLKGTTYGSDEYKEYLKSMGVGLSHHYANNRHHPEYHTQSPCGGIRGMNLIDIVEMLCDWYAATKRHADGDIMSSIEKNQSRFGYSDVLKEIFKNTIAAIDNM